MTNKPVVVEKNEQAAQGVTLSDAARAHIETQLKKRGKGLGVRLSVDKTGCSGLAYVFDYVDELNSNDRHFTVGGIEVYIDKASYPYLRGLSIDFAQQGLNHKFLFKNPNQTGECGCGESFTVDEVFLDKD